MNCPRCQKYIVPEFYCTSCGHVPAKIQESDPSKVTELKIQLSLIDGETAGAPSGLTFL